MIIDFNRNWSFKREGQAPETVDLPHDAMISEQRSADCPAAENNGFFPGGIYIYEKSFDIPDNDIGQCFTLHFEGVYQNCSICVNGQVAGSHRYGFTAFDIDITDYVIAGANNVSVRVDNSLQPNCRWYTGSGIIRPVSLLVRDKDYIKTVHIRTVSIDPALIEVATDGERIDIYEGESLIVSSAPGMIKIPDARLWSAEDPYLYTCIVKKGTDEKRISFGIRELSWSAQEGLLINGERTLLRGGCIHHDHGVLGACDFAAAEERRLRILKENGFNAVRIAHNPASQITLDACDRVGLYVMNETFDGWYTPKTYHDYARWFWEDWKSDAAAMVESARNHPSVIMYSVGNEVSETADDEGVQTCKMLRDFVNSMDSSRPVTAGINVLLNVYTRMGFGVYRDKGDYKAVPLDHVKGYREKKTGSAFFNAMAQKLGKLMFFMSAGKKGDKVSIGAAQSLDILGLNYASSRYDADAAKYPDRMMVGSETMVADLPYNWERVKKFPQLVGDFVWAAWDYLGEACLGDWTYHSYKGLPLFAGQGMIDSTGKPLAAMAFMQVVWGLRKEPFIAVRPLNHEGEKPSTGAWQFTNAIDSWSWQGFEGKKATVEVYTDAAFVRLLLNGSPIKEQPIKEYKAMFRLPYQSGTLTAQALDADRNVISESSLTSGGSETILSVRPEKSVLQADGYDLCYIPIEFTDQNGVLKPYIEQRVDIEVNGDAALAGFGSALCKTDALFREYHHDSYRGRCLAVLRAGTQTGTVTVTVKSKGISPVTIKIEVL